MKARCDKHMEPYSIKQLKEIIETVLHTLVGFQYNIDIDISGGEIPHVKPTPVVLGKSHAVYLFYSPEEKQYLKIGETTVVRRFCYDHYQIKDTVDSSLSKYLMNDSYMVSKYNLVAKDIGEWVINHTSRYNILVKYSDKPFLAELTEAALHYLCCPRYEG